MKSKNINELAAALCKAQSAMQPAKMNATNPFLKNKYADLGAVIEAARKPLADNGLSVAQIVGGDDTSISVETMLMHSSGQWLRSTISMTPGVEKGKSAAQVAGSIITYMRRYSLASILGIYADEDTDGNKVASKAKPAQKVTRPSSAMSIETAENVTSSTGDKYGDLDTETLSHMANAIQRKINEGGYKDDELDEYKMKLDACRVILAERAK